MMSEFLASAILARLGFTLLHAMWEVALLGLLAWGALQLLRSRPAKTRYAFACLSLGAMVAAPALTFIILGTLPGFSGPEAFAGTTHFFLVIREGATLPTCQALLRTLTPGLAISWALGAAFMTLRLAGGLWWLERHYVAPSLPAPTAWQHRAQGLAANLGINRKVRVNTSLAADSPLVIGWFRPVVLIPASAFLHLTPEALEAVLAHELAHICRADYLANLLQSLGEALLFFHPAAWWLSRHVRELREHCCDDLAASLCGNPMALAQGLSALERLRRTPPPHAEPAPRLALGAAKGNLMPRITRLFRPQEAVLPSFRGLALMLAAASLVGAATLAAQSASKPSAAPSTQLTADQAAEVKFDQVQVIDQPNPPAYPAEAKSRRIQGTVVVSVTVNKKGIPVKVEALSGPEELRSTAVGYAKVWKFAPVLIKGKAVTARFQLEMPFKLKPLQEPA